MKYLNPEEVTSLNTHYLSGCDLGDRVMNGRVEIYSFKRVKSEQWLHKFIEERYAESDEVVDVGYMRDPVARSTLFKLISTLNWSFPDYDFSLTKPSQFKRVDLETAKQDLAQNLVHPVQSNAFCSDFGFKFFKILEEQSCQGQVDNIIDVFMYVPIADDDILTDGKLDSTSYFFYSRNLKRIIFITWATISKLYAIPPGHSLETAMDLEESEPYFLHGSRPPSRAEV